MNQTFTETLTHCKDSGLGPESGLKASPMSRIAAIAQSITKTLIDKERKYLPGGTAS